MPVPQARFIMRTTSLFLASLAAAALCGGCDLLDLARNPAINVKLPPQSYSFSTTDARWKSPPATFSQRIDCSMRDDCCTVPGAPTTTPAPFDCAQFSLVCDAGQCGITFPLEVSRPIDLSKELGGMSGSVVSDITLQSMEYTVDNKLGVGLPPVNVYVAPMQVTSVSGGASEATLVGTFPMTAAGVATSGTLTLSAEAQQAFSAHARDLRTPFNLIASTAMLLRSGSPTPMGKVDLTVTGTVRVKF
jgi:hypothetical protein